ncbi:MAG: hypothetical protein ABSF16_17310 [Terracidiphilus sp.]|jgi:serine O-acetyltransferase
MFLHSQRKASDPKGKRNLPIKSWEKLQADLFRYGGKTGWGGFLSVYFGQPGFHFTYYLRQVAAYSQSKKSFGVFGYIFNRMRLNHYRFRFGFEISPTTKIGPGLYLGHFGGVVINPDAVIGSNANIAPGVTIGAESRGAHKGAPTIGNRVWIGTHAIVVGKITIGDDCLIAPGAYVNFDVPAKAIVLGNPGKIVSYKGSMGYVNNTLIDSYVGPPGHSVPRAGVA